MELQDLKDALDELGINNFEAGVSLVLKSCPECGSEQYKVHLRATEEKGLFFGRCYAGKCQQNYSSFSYLLKAGMEYPQVMKVHGMDGHESMRKMVPDIDDFSSKPKDKIEEIIKVDNDISKFFGIKDWIDHPASKYAIKRGVNPDWEHVMIDHDSCSVVFIVFDGKEVLGYQKRFLHPDNPHMKTKTSLGFKKTEHVLVFPNPGKDLLVCEGPFTAVSAWHFGYTGICTFGSGVSEKQISKISQLASQLNVGVGVAFDEDEAGDKGGTRIRSAMYWLEKPTFKVYPSIGNDLNDAWMAQGSALVKMDDVEYNPALPPIRNFF